MSQHSEFAFTQNLRQFIITSAFDGSDSDSESTIAKSQSYGADENDLQARNARIMSIRLNKASKDKPYKAMLGSTTGLTKAGHANNIEKQSVDTFQSSNISQSSWNHNAVNAEPSIANSQDSRLSSLSSYSSKSTTSHGVTHTLQADVVPHKMDAVHNVEKSKTSLVSQQSKVKDLASKFNGSGTSTSSSVAGKDINTLLRREEQKPKEVQRVEQKPKEVQRAPAPKQKSVVETPVDNNIHKFAAALTKKLEEAVRQDEKNSYSKPAELNLSTNKVPVQISLTKDVPITVANENQAPRTQQAQLLSLRKFPGGAKVVTSQATPSNVLSITDVNTLSSQIESTSISKSPDASSSDASDISVTKSSVQSHTYSISSTSNGLICKASKLNSKLKFAASSAKVCGTITVSKEKSLALVTKQLSFSDKLKANSSSCGPSKKISIDRKHGTQTYMEQDKEARSLIDCLKRSLDIYDELQENSPSNIKYEYYQTFDEIYDDKVEQLDFDMTAPSFGSLSRDNPLSRNRTRDLTTRSSSRDPSPERQSLTGLTMCSCDSKLSYNNRFKFGGTSPLDNPAPPLPSSPQRNKLLESTHSRIHDSPKKKEEKATPSPQERIPTPPKSPCRSISPIDENRISLVDRSSPTPQSLSRREEVERKKREDQLAEEKAAPTGIAGAWNRPAVKKKTPVVNRYIESLQRNAKKDSTINTTPNKAMLAGGGLFSRSTPGSHSKSVMASPRAAAIPPRAAPSSRAAAASPRAAPSPRAAAIPPRAAPSPRAAAIPPRAAPSPRAAAIPPRAAPSPRAAAIPPRAAPSPRAAAASPRAAPSPRTAAVSPRAAPSPSAAAIPPRTVPSPRAAAASPRTTMASRPQRSEVNKAKNMYSVTPPDDDDISVTSSKVSERIQSVEKAIQINATQSPPRSRSPITTKSPGLTRKVLQETSITSPLVDSKMNASYSMEDGNYSVKLTSSKSPIRGKNREDKLAGLQPLGLRGKQRTPTSNSKRVSRGTNENSVSEPSMMLANNEKYSNLLSI